MTREVAGRRWSGSDENRVGPLGETMLLIGVTCLMAFDSPGPIGVIVLESVMAAGGGRYVLLNIVSHFGSSRSLVRAQR